MYIPWAAAPGRGRGNARSRVGFPLEKDGERDSVRDCAASATWRSPLADAGPGFGLLSHRLLISHCPGDSSHSTPPSHGEAEAARDSRYRRTRPQGEARERLVQLQNR